MSTQNALFLLRSSVSLLLHHLLRQLNPSGLRALWKAVDKAIEDLIGKLAARGPADTGAPFNRDLVSLSVRDGGLGLLRYIDLMGETYLAV